MDARVSRSLKPVAKRPLRSVDSLWKRQDLLEQLHHFRISWNIRLEKADSATATTLACTTATTRRPCIPFSRTSGTATTNLTTATTTLATATTTTTRFWCTCRHRRWVQIWWTCWQRWHCHRCLCRRWLRWLGRGWCPLSQLPRCSRIWSRQWALPAPMCRIPISDPSISGGWPAYTRGSIRVGVGGYSSIARAGWERHSRSGDFPCQACHERGNDTTKQNHVAAGTLARDACRSRTFHNWRLSRITPEALFRASLLFDEVLFCLV